MSPTFMNTADDILNHMWYYAVWQASHLPSDACRQFTSVSTIHIQKKTEDLPSTANECVPEKCNKSWCV